MFTCIIFQPSIQSVSLDPANRAQGLENDADEIVLDNNVDPDVRARVIGVQAKMESFDYFFGISVSELVLNHGDNLSAALQSTTISAAEGQHIASLTVSTIDKIRSDQ